jgi:RND superfamily putative drug exporter
MVDSKSALGARLPLAGGIIALVTLVVLFAMFGSLLVPVKAVVLNLLSLTATFGAMVFVFQEGHGSGLLGFTPTGALLVVMPVLMFCIAFGLSMDYEVFLLSRIKEQHDAGAGTTESVAAGLEQTGRIVTAAAALLAIVFLAFATSGVSFMKLFGVGLTLAVLMDATLIRGVLVPAFMRLAGEANWWAPGPLRRLHDRFGVSESDGAASPAPAPRPLQDERSHAFPAA